VYSRLLWESPTSISIILMERKDRLRIHVGIFVDEPARRGYKTALNQWHRDSPGVDVFDGALGILCVVRDDPGKGCVEGCVAKRSVGTSIVYRTDVRNELTITILVRARSSDCNNINFECSRGGGWQSSLCSGVSSVLLPTLLQSGHCRHGVRTLCERRNVSRTQYGAYDIYVCLSPSAAVTGFCVTPYGRSVGPEGYVKLSLRTPRSLHSGRW